MAGGYVDLHSVQPTSQKLELNRINAENLQSSIVFDGMSDRIKADPSLTKKINGVFQYKITKGGKVVETWSKSVFISYGIVLSLLLTTERPTHFGFLMPQLDLKYHLRECV